MKDVLALVATAGWFAANIALWVTIPSVIGLFAWSVALGILFFAGFFAYLSYRERRSWAQSDKKAMLTIVGVLSWATAAPAADLNDTASVVDGDTAAVHVHLGRNSVAVGACECAGDPAFDCGRLVRLAPRLEYPAAQFASWRSPRAGDWRNDSGGPTCCPNGTLH